MTLTLHGVVPQLGDLVPDEVATIAEILRRAGPEPVRAG